MSSISVKNISIKGMAGCVPSRVVENRDFPGMSAEEIQKYINVTGVERRHCAIHDGSICTSDLCQKAAEKLLSDLNWSKSEIDLLVFVSHTTDYKLPATAIVLQDKMGIPTSCLAFDITLGCSGFLVGLGVMGNLMASGFFRKGLLMVGNTQSEYASPEDRSMALLLGDAGTVTAIEYNPASRDEMNITYMSDGSGREFVILPDGGSRNPVSEKSFVMEDCGDGIRRSRLHEKMIGDEVFSYGTFYIPKVYNEMREKFNVEPDDVDYLLLHQANKFLCEKLRKKMKFPPEKVPYNIQEFGNTSGATIPLLMVTELQHQLKDKDLNMLAATIGVGFSLGVAQIKTHGGIIVPDLLFL
jgi:3-oxoacyl-[acyl-carrier-protein] synthase-3